MAPLVYRVEERRGDLADTATLTLAPVAEAIEPPAPGQFNMIWVMGVGEIPISLAGSDGSNLHHTVRCAGKTSTALWDSRPGDMLGVRGPFGTGWNLSRFAGRDILIVAGGLGLAPLRPAIEELLANREDFGRAVLLIGARSPDALLYDDEVESWRGRLDLEVAVTVDSAPPSWRGDVGVVTGLMGRAPIDPAKTTSLVCGPEVMMRFVSQMAVDLGIPSDQVMVSLERNMRCAVGHCGHCQLGPAFICRTGPVMAWSEVGHLIRMRER